LPLFQSLQPGCIALSQTLPLVTCNTVPLSIIQLTAVNSSVSFPKNRGLTPSQSDQVAVPPIRFYPMEVSVHADSGGYRASQTLTGDSSTYASPDCRLHDEPYGVSVQYDVEDGKGR
jgi:hypothetical protein